MEKLLEPVKMQLDDITTQLDGQKDQLGRLEKGTGILVGIHVEEKARSKASRLFGSEFS